MDFFGCLVEEGVSEGSGPGLLDAALVDDDVLPHEVQESARVGVRVARRNQVTVSAIQPDFDVVLAGLLEVVALQVVDNRQVVDVASA